MSDKEHFSSYFTGLFEVSGGIYIPKGKYPKISISFHKENLALAEAITTEFNEVVKLLSLKERIGYGNIYEKKTAYSYEIFNRDGILKFIEITRCYYRTPLIEKFNHMIEYLNTYKNCNLPLAEIDESTFDSNGWLSGFLEISGSFFLSVFEERYFIYNKGDCRNQKYLRCQTIFDLKHKKDGKISYLPFFSKLASFLETNLTEKVVYNDLCFSIRFANNNSIQILIKYLKKYHLFGRQYINYCIFKNGYSSSMANVVYQTKTKDTKENKEFLIREILDIHPVTFDKYNHDNSSIEEIKSNYIKEHLKLFPKLD